MIEELLIITVLLNCGLIVAFYILLGRMDKFIMSVEQRRTLTELKNGIMAENPKANVTLLDQQPKKTISKEEIKRNLKKSVNDLYALHEKI